MDVGTVSGQMWKRLLSFSVIGAFGYVLLEWLFFATKPSFMSSLSGWNKLLLLLLATLPLALLSALWVGFFWLLHRILRARGLEPFLFGLGSVLPALLFGFASFLLINNFSNTVLDFGVRRVNPPWTLVYWLLLAVLFGWGVRIFWKLSRTTAGSSRWPLILATVLLLVSASASAWQYVRLLGKEVSFEGLAPRVRPNILIFGSDGLNSERLSLYGYERDTTPFARELGNESLVFENAFANSSHTGASLVSMLTGKLPTTTRLIYPPDILRGEDAFQHLPAILKRLGYRSADISIRHYADMLDLNMRDSFDLANSRRMSDRELSSGIRNLLGVDAAYFIDSMKGRVVERLSHLAGLSRIEDVFAQVASEESKVSRSDEERLRELFDFVQESDGPFFAHVHLMQTHGPGFRPAEFVFSNPDEPVGSMNRYDDAILEFDGFLRRTVEFLREEGLLENTLFVLYSDHGFNFETFVRVPLLVRFPNQELTGRVTENVENLGVPSTILDYLGIPQPEWMEGRSFLPPSGSTRPDSSEAPIFSMKRSSGNEVRRGDFWELDVDAIGPPFFSLGAVTAVICDNWYEIRVQNGALQSGKVAGHTGDCDASSTLTEAQARNLIDQHLIDRGYTAVRSAE